MNTRARIAFALYALACLGLTACASQEEPARTAVADLEASLAQIGEMSAKYLPDAHQAMQDEIDSLQADLEAGEFDTVVGKAAAVSAGLRKLQADSIVARASVREAMTREWEAMSQSVPALLSRVDRELGRYTGSGRVPRGMDRDGFKALLATLDEARSRWASAVDTGNAGDYEQAVMLGREAQASLQASASALGTPTD
jgi:predicted outer membrane protein